MAGAWTTLTVLDGGGISRTMRVWDESGAGTGPYTFAQLASNQTGTGSQLSLEGGNLSLLATAVSGTTMRVIPFVGASAVGAANSLPVQITSGSGLTAVISGTAFISGGNLTSVVSGTTFLSGGNVTAVVSGTVTAVVSGTTFISGGNVTSVVSGTTFLSGGNVTAVVSGTTFLSGGNATAAINQGGSALSTTNGIFSNLLLGNAAIASTNPLFVGGDTASGVTDANNPVKIGGLAKSTNPTGVTDGQRVAGLFDLLGKKVMAQSIRALKANLFTSLPSTTSEITLLPAISTCFQDIYGCIIANTSASTNTVIFKDSTAGTTQFELNVPGGDTRGFMMGESAAFKQTAQNTTWTVTMGLAVTSMIASVLYVKNTTS